jgi:hypothetical protein
MLPGALLKSIVLQNKTAYLARPQNERRGPEVLGGGNSGPEADALPLY